MIPKVLTRFMIQRHKHEQLLFPTRPQGVTGLRAMCRAEYTPVFTFAQFTAACLLLKFERAFIVFHEGPLEQTLSASAMIPFRTSPKTA